MQLYSQIESSNFDQIIIIIEIRKSVINFHLISTSIKISHLMQLYISFDRKVIKIR